MTIARELVTKLSFQVDKKGIQNFDRAINNIKSKFNIASLATTGFFAGFTKALSSISTAILDTSDLAKSTGLAVRELVGLQEAAKKFRISPNEINNAILNLTQLREQAQAGSGALFELARNAQINIRDQRGEILPTLELFDLLIDALAKFDDVQKRRFDSKTIFGSERFADIAEEGIDSFKQLRISLESTADAFIENESKAKRFDESLTNLSTSFKNLSFQVLPPFLDAFSNIFEVIDESIRNPFRPFGVFNPEDYNLGNLSRFSNEDSQRLNENRLESALDLLIPKSAQRLGSNVNVTNNINVEVPAGTTQEQAQFLESAATQSFSAQFEDAMMGILVNNPEVE